MSSNERTPTAEKNYSYQKFVWTLLNEAELHNLPVEVIGSEASEYTGIIYPLYRLVINPHTKPTICIVSGVHGNEIAGPLSILHLIKDILHLLPEYRYVIYPLMNPSGFDLRQRFDDDGRDLNAIYRVTLKSHNYQEVQNFYQDVLKFVPFEAVLTLHEDSDLDKFYMYGLGKENLDFYRAICAFARTWIPVWANADIYGCQSDEYGLISSTARDHAFDATLFAQGHTGLACTLETPGKLDIDFRVNMMAQLVLMSLTMLRSRRWMTSPLPDKAAA